MIGIDTNVLVRYLAQDDETQSPIATHFIESLSPERRGFVSLVVLVEITWVMQRSYGASKEETAEILTDLLEVEDLAVEHPSIVWRALDRFSKENCDFSDCLIAEIAQQVGCTKTVTFDRKAAQRAGMTLLKG